MNENRINLGALCVPEKPGKRRFKTEILRDLDSISLRELESIMK